MSEWIYLLAGLFLPLFPLSMGFNLLLEYTPYPLLRIVLLLLWPQAGLLLLATLNPPLPDFVPYLALATSGLYALRALALREVGQWSGFLATSAWALLWIPLHGGTALVDLHWYALGFSLPLVLLVLLAHALQQRFGAAYTGLYGGLAESMPRFATILVFVVLAIIATPLFPAFFIMLASILQAAGSMPGIAVGIAGVWLLWSWSGARLLQGLIAGPTGNQQPADLNQAVTWSYTLALLLLAIAGVYALGGLA